MYGNMQLQALPQGGIIEDKKLTATLEFVPPNSDFYKYSEIFYLSVIAKGF